MFDMMVMDPFFDIVEDPPSCSTRVDMGEPFVDSGDPTDLARGVIEKVSIDASEERGLVKGNDQCKFKGLVEWTEEENTVRRVLGENKTKSFLDAVLLVNLEKRQPSS